MFSDYFPGFEQQTGTWATTLHKMYTNLLRDLDLAEKALAASMVRSEGEAVSVMSLGIIPSHRFLDLLMFSVLSFVVGL